MQETLLLLYNILFYGIIFFALCALMGVILSLKSKEYKILKKRIFLLNPTYYLFFSIITFSFIIVLALKKHFILIDLFFALFLAIILLGGIKIYKISKTKESFERFKSFAVKKYCCDMLVCAIFHFFIVLDAV
ncbi:MAG: hypothetical protein LBS39_02810 [Campylobacteraceae bacterium]|jgi:hypothetical protein|nr:hypothetical protein [Campylobacteraceae bacterium]